ncbi:MAG: hypothetical protein GXP27_10155 [Planctomycetes bacterium]|nr:hypothetical protein [Planctomycetota bacterium]
MDLATQLSEQLRRLAGTAPPGAPSINLTGPDGLTVAIDLTAVDSLSCAFRELRLHVPSLVGVEFEALKAWADALSRRVTYLLEHIEPLEFSPDDGAVLMRSTPPGQGDQETSYYEIFLQSHPGGNFTLRRFRAERGQPGRQPVDIELTYTALKRLINDLIATIPSR